jgi:major membrane immunogen (membrane-anchored lipoprotein)
MTIAYIYKWTHLPTYKWYIGSRTKNNCHPDDGYICSSKIVKPLIKESPNEWKREIMFTGDPAEILVLEAEILKLLDAKNDFRSFNMHNGDGKFTTAGIEQSEEWKKNISIGNQGKKRSIESKENYKRSNQLKSKDPEYLKKLRKPKPAGHGEKVSAALKGVPKSEEHKLSMSKVRKGKSTGPCSDLRRMAISQSLKGKHTLPLVTCPHCGLEGRSSMKRWHFDNCKKAIK